MTFDGSGVDIAGGPRILDAEQPSSSDLSERLSWREMGHFDQSRITRTAHVWLTRVPSCNLGDRRARYESLLSADEIERYRRFYFEADRITFLIAHALVRTALSHYAPTPPAEWRFRCNRYGRPEIDPVFSPSTLRFNLTHASGLVGCVVTDGVDCGVDVESIRPVGNLLRLARSVLAPQELAELRSRAPASRLSRFYQYWTLKESYIKARGVGLSLPLRGIDFRFDGARLTGFATSDAVGDDPARWQFSHGQVDRTHKLAVALRRPDSSGRAVSCRFIQP